jgi:hypothetical protein
VCSDMERQHSSEMNEATREIINGSIPTLCPSCQRSRLPLFAFEIVPSAFAAPPNTPASLLFLDPTASTARLSSLLPRLSAPNLFNRPQSLHSSTKFSPPLRIAGAHQSDQWNLFRLPCIKANCMLLANPGPNALLLFARRSIRSTSDNRL